MLRETGAEKVDIVGHSEGSLMPDWYVRFLGGAKVVDDYVGMTTLWEGTNLAGLATLNQLGAGLGLDPAFAASVDELCTSCRQFLQGSKFFERLHAKGVNARRVTYTSIVTKNDELVMPYTSGLMAPAPNVTNVVLQDYCALDQAEHLSVASDPVTAGFVYRALDPQRRTGAAVRPGPAGRRRAGLLRRLSPYLPGSTMPVRGFTVAMATEGTHTENGQDTDPAGSAISRGIVGIYAELYGRGPTGARSFVNGEYVLTVLDESYTVADRTLIAAGKPRQVEETRRAFQEAARERFIEVVESATDGKVRVFMSQLDPDTGTAIELFLMEPPNS